MEKLKPIEIGYTEEKYIFYPRLISTAEEDDIDKRFRDTLDSSDKWAEQFAICRDVLIQYADHQAEQLVKKKGEFVNQPIDVAAVFAERTPANERILRDAYALFRQELAPESRFLAL